MSLCLYVSELLDSMPANEKLPISKARLLRLFKDAQRVLSSAEMLGTRGSSGGWMSETDLSKRKSFQFGLLEFRYESKSIRGEFVAGLLKANLFLKIL